MKNFHLILSALFLILPAEILKAQSGDSKESKIKFGAGIDIEIADISNNPVLPPANILLSFDLFNKLRIEPGFGFNLMNVDAVNHEITALYKRQCYNLGLYWLITNRQVAPYLGMNYDYIRDFTDHESQESISSVSFETRFGPVLGLEYRCADKFSISGEFSFLRTKKHESTLVNNEERNQSGDSWQSGNKIKFRFYL